MLCTRNSKFKKECILVIPGNHDFRLTDYEPTDFSHERPFNMMLREFYGTYDPNERFRRFSFPSGHHVEFLLINSVRLRKKEEANYGYVEWSLYESRLKARKKDVGVTRVAVLHHHLISIPREELLEKEYPHAGISTTLDSGAVIEGLQAHGFRLALHGHQHVPGMAHISRGIISGGDAAIPQPDLAILSAGSAGAKGARLADAMRDNSYNVLQFLPEEVHIEARRFNAGMAGSHYFSARLPK
jgi:Calcineurin-like phosphoesterase